MNYVDQDRLVQIYIELARQNTPPKHERDAAEVALNHLQSLGFSCIFDDAGVRLDGNTGNLIAFKKGNVAKAPGILLTINAVSPPSWKRCT
jgi:tripeptide aminopeptidase